MTQFLAINKKQTGKKRQNNKVVLAVQVKEGVTST